MDGTIVLLMIKAAGALAGSGCAIAFQPPQIWRDFFQRLGFASVCGVLFADPLRIQYLKWDETWEMVLASAALVSLVAWPVFAAAIRIAGAWKPK